MKLYATIAAIALAGAAGGAVVTFATRAPTPARAKSPAPLTVATPNPAVIQATALYHQALVALSESPGFHYVAISPGPESETIVGDAGRGVGRQVITLKTGYGVEDFSLLLIATDVVYFEGNIPALEDQLGVSSGHAATLQDTWISVSPFDGPYSILAPGMTVNDQVNWLPLSPASTSSVHSGATTLTRISGAVETGAITAKAYLDIDAGSDHPTAYVSTTTVDGKPATTSDTFSDWGELVAVAPPAGAIKWSTLGARPPKDGYGGGVFG